MIALHSISDSTDETVARSICVRIVAPGMGISRRFATLSGAQRFAQGKMGYHPRIAGGVAVDGPRTLAVTGATVWELFP